MSELVEVPNEATTEDDLAWRKPQVRRLNVSLDTQDAGGSEVDGAFGTVEDT